MQLRTHGPHKFKERKSETEIKTLLRWGSEPCGRKVYMPAKTRIYSLVLSLSR